MGVLEILLLGVGLSMDAVAVTITNVLGYKNLKSSHKTAMAIAFGVFQGGMPLLGYYAGNLFADFINRYAGIITLIVLGYIGGNMIKEAYEESHSNKEETEQINNESEYSYKVLFFQAIATSIDAFAVGVSFAALQVDVVFACSAIAITTSILCFVALYVGKKFGEILGERAQLLGGIILVLIGIKAIL